REDLPRGDREREVARRDDAADADRPAVAHGPLVAQLARHRVAEEPPPLRGRVIGRVNALLHVAARFFEDLAHLPRHDPGDLLLARGQDVTRAADDVAPPGRRGPAPALEPLTGGLDRSLHVLGTGERPQADEVVPVRGIAVLEVFPRG